VGAVVVVVEVLDDVVLLVDVVVLDVDDDVVVELVLVVLLVVLVEVSVGAEVVVDELVVVVLDELVLVVDVVDVVVDVLVVVGAGTHRHSTRLQTLPGGQLPTSTHSLIASGSWVSKKQGSMHVQGAPASSCPQNWSGLGHAPPHMTPPPPSRSRQRSTVGTQAQSPASDENEQICGCP
jgi:hypothetical protein